MSTIESLLNEKRTLCHAVCNSKKRSLEMLADLISASTENIEAETLFEQLIAREKLGSTGIGAGIAIPHCRYKGLELTTGALVTLENPIDFDSVDGKPVDVIFAMLVPEDSHTEHLQTLAKLAEFLQQQSFVDKLRGAKTQDELYRLAVQIG